MLLPSSRVPVGPYGQAIGAALDVIPVAVVRRLEHVRFVCGVDPVFAGLHRYGDTGDGRSYAVTAHCCYRFHLDGPADRRVTTVVLPVPADATVPVIVHELGHALHEVVGLDHVAVPVSAYATTNTWEAFAEAFTAWVLPGYGDQEVACADRPTRALLEGLGT